MIDQAKQRGRKPIEAGKRMVKRMVSIDEETVEILRAVGNGNLSAGIRAAADALGQRYHNDL